MSSSKGQSTLRTAGLLAMTLGGTALMAPAARAARVRCEVTSASSTNIDEQNGFAEALVNMAGFACGDGDVQSMPIDESVATVASAMAEAVAEVIGTCTGEGNAQATVAGISRAEARAEAVGQASARLLTNSEVCSKCTAVLDSIAMTVQNVSATAVAEASIGETFQFEEGDEQVMTAEDVQRAVEENIIDVLASVTGELHTSTLDGCSGNAVTRAEAGDNFAMCDVAISADEMVEEIDATADAGAAVRALVCEGEGNEAEVRVIAREIAHATAMAIVQAESLCESRGGPGTLACGLSNATMTAVAEAQANAFAEGLAMTMGEGCDCDLATNISASMMETIMAEATTSALAQSCAEEDDGFATANDFQIAVEESLGFAVAEVIGEAISGADCSAFIDGCAESGECVERFEQCSGPGIDGMLRCCDPEDVCASLMGSPEYLCESRELVAQMPESMTATVDCGP